MRLISGVTLLLVHAALLLGAGLPAFPGAEGFGTQTSGGRGGRVIYVTSLADQGPGTLREALGAKGSRMVLFATGGLITLETPLVLREPFVTVAGQSAPGDGICLRGAGLVVATHDVVIRHLRSRLGDLKQLEGDALSIATPSYNVVLDHVSASWSVDESLSPSGEIHDVTVQWSFITESLKASLHKKGSHGYGSLVRAVGGVSLHHNLWAHHSGRSPRLGDNYGKGAAATYDFRNNVIYNWGAYCTGLVDGRIRVNYVGNTLKPGAESNKKRLIYLGEKAGEETQFYLAGNVVEGMPEVEADNGLLFSDPARGKRVGEAFVVPVVGVQGAKEAYDAVLAGAGATLPKRDLVDARVVASVRGATGKLIDSQQDVGAWPVYVAGVPFLDTDQDGIPDAWERRNGLDAKDGTDGAKLSPSGYSWLEEYLESLGRGTLRKGF
jgi:hypothetical protein